MKQSQPVGYLEARCAALFASYYALMYVAMVMFSTYMVLLEYDSAMIALTMSVSGAAGLLMRSLLGVLIDKGLCRISSAVFILMMAAGTAVFFFGSADRTFRSAVLYTLLCNVPCICCMDLVDGWALKLVKQTGMVDYGKARAFGSASFAIVSLCYGWMLTRYGIGIAPWTIFVFLGLLLICVLLNPDPNAETSSAKDNGLAAGFRQLRNRKFLVFVICSAVVNAAFNLSDAYIPVLILEKGGSTVEAGISSFLMAGIEFVFLRRYTEIADRIGTDRTVWLGMIGFFVKCTLVSLMPTPWLIILACTTQIISFCLCVPSRMRFVAENVDEGNMGSAMSVVSLGTSLFGTFISNPAASALMPVIGTDGTLIVFGVLAGLAGIVFALFSRSSQHNNTEST